MVLAFLYRHVDGLFLEVKDTITNAKTDMTQNTST